MNFSITAAAILLLHSFTSPTFNFNYITISNSPNKRFTIICVPDRCKNASNAMINIIDNQNKELHNINIKRISGYSFIISNNGSLIFKIPTYIGFPTFSYNYTNDQENFLEEKFSNIYVYKLNNYTINKIDSIKIDKILLNDNNRKIISKRGKILPSKLINVTHEYIYIQTRNKCAVIDLNNPFDEKIEYLNSFPVLSKNFKSKIISCKNKNAYITK